MATKGRLEGKVAIVTASTQGIGFAIAERFGIDGASVVISSRKQVSSPLSILVYCGGFHLDDYSDFAVRVLGAVRLVSAEQKNVDEAVEKLRSKGIDVVGVVCHVSNPQHRKHLIETTVQKYGHIDIVVSNAAANPSIDTVLNTEESVLDKLWEINVKSAILILKAAEPHLRKGSSVILISSIAGYHLQASMAMYGVTKTALLGLTKVLATEMSPDTRVNCIAPGFVPTHFADFITTNEAIRKTIEEQTPLKRLGSTGDMASAAAFLASDDSSFITGETIVVAGGMPSRL